LEKKAEPVKEDVAPAEKPDLETKPPASKESIFRRAVEKPVPEKVALVGTFQSKVEAWFSANSIEIVKRDVKRKGKEIEYFVSSRDPIEQKYFVKCKDKKRVSESDISLTYTEAMQKKMPAIFITSGKISKKILGTVEKKFGGLVKIVII
jgi:hypothetical protein